MLAGFRRRLLGANHSGHRGGLEILHWIGPGLLVTVGFIDPGNWATNMAAGSTYGYGLLWVVTLSTVMLVILQHNVAHLGIVTGECLAESCARHLPCAVSRPVLASAYLACVATMMAEVLGGGIALQMLLGLDVRVDDLAQAAATLEPMLGPAVRHIFALALLLAGLASSVTAGMAAGTVSAGIAGEPYDIHDRHSSLGVVGAFLGALVAIMFVGDPFEGLVWSQALLSLQLPVTAFVQIWLTSSPRVMGAYANGTALKAVLVLIALIVTVLNAVLLAGA